jgi:hypothetical protein
MKTISSLDARAEALRELQTIPGVGPSIARDLVGLGVFRVAQLKRKSPERLYRRLEEQVGTHVDRCALYVFRCAVYYAENERHDPRLLKWWNWKDGPGGLKEKPAKSGSGTDHR